MTCNRFQSSLTRREMLLSSASGFASLALAAMTGSASGVSARPPGPTPALPPHFNPRAKRIIFLFMWGGPSHVDIWDPKPKLNEHAGKQLNGKDVGSDRDKLGPLLGSPFKFARHGQSGLAISELQPHLARHADKLCVVRSLHTNGTAHGEALLWLHTGAANLVRPSVGAWVSYGLGCESENLPAFITISPPRGHGGVQNYGSAFLPAIHQGTAIGSAEIPIRQATLPNLANPRIKRDLQQSQLNLIQSLNRDHLRNTGGDPGIEGLIGSYELAYRMQSTVPRIMSLDDESQATKDLYGIDQDPTDNLGRQCLLARKFAEQGVRYIQVSTDYTWDHHTKVKDGSVAECAKSDKPVAGLLADLEQRGLLDDTLVLWGGEFGRTPMVENINGRNHHPKAFTVWMAGGGVKPGFTYGATDDFGYAPVDKPTHMHDLHATLLHALGMDHLRLTHRHAGRDFRLTNIYGNVAHGVFG